MKTPSLLLLLPTLAHSLYTEYITLAQTSSSSILTKFKFQNTHSFSNESIFHNFNTFPPAIHELMSDPDLHALYITFTRGRAPVLNLEPVLSNYGPAGLQVDIITYSQTLIK